LGVQNEVLEFAENQSAAGGLGTVGGGYAKRSREIGFTLERIILYDATASEEEQVTLNHKNGGKTLGPKKGIWLERIGRKERVRSK